MEGAPCSTSIPATSTHATATTTDGPTWAAAATTSDNARVPERATRDPRDIAIRHVDLPRGPRREPVRVRDRDYEINGNQSRVLATVGAFRVVSSRDLEASLGRAGNPRSSDLRHLRESGLVQTVPLPGHRDRVVTLTEHGRELLEARRRPGEDGRAGVLRGCPEASRTGARHAGLSRLPARPPTASPSAAIACGASSSTTSSSGSTSASCRSGIETAPTVTDAPTGVPRRSPLWAVEHNLPYFDEHVHFPDVRIEYEDDRRARPRGGRGGDDGPLPRRPRGGRRALRFRSVRRVVRASFGRRGGCARRGRRTRDRGLAEETLVMTTGRTDPRRRERSVSPRARPRFLVTVMSHSGVCLPRQYATFAGVAYGHKINRFFDRLVARGFASACPCLHNRAARLPRPSPRPLPGDRRTSEPVPTAGSGGRGRAAADAARRRVGRRPR